MSNPTLVFCAGAWYSPVAYGPLIERLPEYTCRTVAFPSIEQANEVKDLQPDITAVRSVVEKECDAGNDVAIVLHSWSGLPVSSALDGLSKTERQEAGKPGGVVKLIYLSAFIPEVGESLIGAFGGVPPDWYVRDVENGTVLPDDPFKLFFHDVPDGQKWAETLRPHAWATKNSPATSAAYLRIPSAYLLCEDDRAIPLFAQEGMVEKARAKGATFETDKVKTGHTPWLVVPDQLVEFVKRHA